MSDEASRVKAASEELMKNEAFLDLFQKALNGREIPAEGDPTREAFLKELQDKIAAEASKDSDVVKDDDGEWMWVVPQPGFCIKCHTVDKRMKVFVNICKHDRVAAPTPMSEVEAGDDPELKNSVKVRIPISMNRGRSDFDKAGKPCKVYDCIVHPETIERCSQEHEFRRFVAALAMSWLRQKYEPDLNDEEFTNVNIRAKGELQRQRIRLARPNVNALNNELKLPGAQPGAAGGAPPKIEDITPNAQQERHVDPLTEAAAEMFKPLKKETEEDAANRPSHKLTHQGDYDWSTHKRPTHNEYFRSVVPEHVVMEAILPGVQTIKEVVVEVRGRDRQVALTDVDKAEEPDAVPFYVVPLPFPVDEDPVAAKFVRKRCALILTLRVQLPDEVKVESELSKAAREDAAKEAAEERALRERKEAEQREHVERQERLRREEEDVVKQRKQFVDDLQTTVAGGLPKEMEDHFASMPPEQQRTLMIRLEARKRLGDSVDEMLDKMPPDFIDRIVLFLRSKLGLEAPKPKPQPKDTVSQQQKENADEAKNAKKKDEADTAKKSDEDKSVEYNNSKKGERLFGVKLTNRYLWALDH